MAILCTCYKAQCDIETLQTIVLSIKISKQFFHTLQYIQHNNSVHVPLSIEKTDAEPHSVKCTAPTTSPLLKMIQERLYKNMKQREEKKNQSSFLRRTVPQLFLTFFLMN